MTTQSWQTFGGCQDSAGHFVPAETDLQQWANERSLSPMQAQALLCDSSLFANSFRAKLLLPHVFQPGLVQGYNKSAAACDKVTQFKVWLNPMHLMVQEAYFKAKVLLAMP